MIKKKVNKYIKFFDKNILRIFFITVIFLVFLQEFNFFSNTYYLINKGHDTRATEYLIDAITIINSFEINFKNVNNKRVHIELGLMQLASLHFNGEKKKVS